MSFALESLLKPKMSQYSSISLSSAARLIAAKAPQDKANLRIIGSRIIMQLHNHKNKLCWFDNFDNREGH